MNNTLGTLGVFTVLEWDKSWELKSNLHQASNKNLVSYSYSNHCSRLLTLGFMVVLFVTKGISQLVFICIHEVKFCCAFMIHGDVIV